LAVTVNNDDSGPFTSAVGFLTSKPLTSSKLMDFTENKCKLSMFVLIM
jgi:hypothetical protein